jgi:hypothetical protein
MLLRPFPRARERERERDRERERERERERGHGGDIWHRVALDTWVGNHFSAILLNPGKELFCLYTKHYQYL